MFHKWTQEEDVQLRRLVLQHTTDWHRIEETFSSKRSRNALIKRWHTKLKMISEPSLEDVILQLLPEQGKSSITDSTLLHKTQGQMQLQPCFSRVWTEFDDKKLHELIVIKHEYDWEVLALKMEVSQNEVKRHWEQRIYPVIKSQRKIAGALMWTKQQDEIIFHAIRKEGYKWEKLLSFLPGRSYFSLEARWKRILTHYQSDKKSSTRNIQKMDIRAINHSLRLRQYRNILKLRKTVRERLSDHNSKEDMSGEM